MKKILLTTIMLLSAPFVSFAQATTTNTVVTPVSTTSVTTAIADPGLVPGDFFYFLDRWSEVINTALTFNKEKKARLHLEYAKERVAEIKEVLKKPDAKLQDVASAKDNFDAQIADATNIVKSEKEKGIDVASLASDLGVELDKSSIEIKDVLREHKNNAIHAENEIRAKIQSVSDTDPAQVQELTKELEAATKEKSDTATEEDGLNVDILDKQSVFDQVMGTELSAKKHVEEAVRLGAQVEEKSGQFSQEESTQIMKQTRQAQEAIKRGDFETASRISEEAVRKIEDIKTMRYDAEASAIVSGSASLPATNMSSSTPSRANVESNNSVDVQHIDTLEKGIKKSEREVEGIEKKSVENESNNR